VPHRPGRAGRAGAGRGALALRDLSRYRARSAAALSAISFAVLLAALIGILAAARYANPLDYTGPNLAANQFLLYPPGHIAGPSAAPPTAHYGAPRGIRDLPARLAGALGIPAALALDSAARPGLRMVSPSGQDLGPITATLNQAGTPTNNYSGPLYVATPALLRYFGISPHQINPDADVLTMRPGLAAEPRMQLTLPCGPGSARRQTRTPAPSADVSPTRRSRRSPGFRPAPRHRTR